MTRASRWGSSWYRSAVQVDDCFDVVGVPLQGIGPAVQRDPAGDEAFQPGRVGLGEAGRGGLVVAAVGVDGAKDQLILQDQLAVEGTGVDGQSAAGRGDAGQADDAVGSG